MRRITSIVAFLGCAAVPAVAHADDVVGLAAFVGGASASRSNVTTGEGVSFGGGWLTDVTVGSGSASYRLGVDALLGGGDHVLAQRLGVALLPGARAKLGGGTTAAFRLGVDGRYENVTSFSARHLSLPFGEIALRWTSRRSMAESTGGPPYGVPEIPAPDDSWLSSFATGILGLAALLDPTRGRDAVSIDVALHGGLALLGDWTFATITDGARRDVPGAITVMNPSGALGGKLTLAVSALQFRASYTGFHGTASVHEVRSSVCGTLAVVGACLDAFVVRMPTTGAPSGHEHALGATGMLSLGLMFGSHGTR
jgi:hypothetical protein